MAMLMTWSLTIISFAVIFIDLDGWAQPYPHEIFGIIATIICFIQPIIAMFRPNVSSPKRKYFNLAHISFGSIAFGLASINDIFNQQPIVNERLLKLFVSHCHVFCGSITIQWSSKVIHFTLLRCKYFYSEENSL